MEVQVPIRVPAFSTFEYVPRLLDHMVILGFVMFGGTYMLFQATALHTLVHLVLIRVPGGKTTIRPFSWDFPAVSEGKESAYSAGDSGLMPGLGRSPGEGDGCPLQYSWAFLVAHRIKNSPAMQCRRPRFNHWVRKTPWRKSWQPTPVFLPGEFHGQRILVGCSLWGHRVRQDWATDTCISFSMDEEMKAEKVNLSIS